MRAAPGRDVVGLFVLDLILPDADGFEIMRALRLISRVPVILPTARSEIYDRIVALALGADDYMTEPYELRELLARIRSVLRRTHRPEDLPGAAAAARLLRCWDFTIDVVEMHVTCGAEDTPVALTSTQVALLKALASAAGEVLSREPILGALDGNAVSIADRAIDAHVARLRRKLAPDGGADMVIRTVHGLGCTLAAAVQSA
jgi:DNA-binding response OmpR family regulator